MNELISGQKLIEEVERLRTAYNFSACAVIGKENCEGSCADCILDSLEEFINSQPPADQWIPCSERLPDTEEEVWVILGYTYKSDCTQKSIARYIRFENGEAHWCDNKWGYLEWEKYSDGHGGCSSYKVLAWMPAEPYKGE